MTATIQPADIGSDNPVAAEIAALIADAPVPNPTLARTFAAMMARDIPAPAGHSDVVMLDGPP